MGTASKGWRPICVVRTLLCAIHEVPQNFRRARGRMARGRTSPATGAAEYAAVAAGPSLVAMAPAPKVQDRLTVSPYHPHVMHSIASRVATRC